MICANLTTKCKYLVFQYQFQKLDHQRATGF